MHECALAGNLVVLPLICETLLVLLLLGASKGEGAEGNVEGVAGDVEETSARWFLLWTVSLSVGSSVGLFSALSSRCVLVCVSV